MKENAPIENNETLIAEIKEEIGRERLENFFKKFKKPLIGLIAFIIIGFSGYEIWKYYTEKSRQEAGSALYSVISDVRAEGNIAKLEAISTSTAAAQLAELTRAKLLASENKTDEAVQAYKAIYENKSNKSTITDIARINAANILMNIDPKHPKIDSILDSSAFGGTFSHNLQELAAMNALNNARNEQAIELLKGLVSDSETPTSVNLRAQSQLAKLGVDLDTEETEETSIEPANGSEEGNE